MLIRKDRLVAIDCVKAPSIIVEQSELMRWDQGVMILDTATRPTLHAVAWFLAGVTNRQGITVAVLYSICSVLSSHDSSGRN